jgi:hypothetical protein
MRCSKKAQQDRWYGQAERLGRLEVDDKFNLGKPASSFPQTRKMM